MNIFFRQPWKLSKLQLLEGKKAGPGCQTGLCRPFSQPALCAISGQAGAGLIQTPDCTALRISVGGCFGAAHFNPVANLHTVKHIPPMNRWTEFKQILAFLRRENRRGILIFFTVDWEFYAFRKVREFGPGNFHLKVDNKSHLANNGIVKIYRRWKSTYNPRSL